RYVGNVCALSAQPARGSPAAAPTLNTPMTTTTTSATAKTRTRIDNRSFSPMVIACLASPVDTVSLPCVHNQHAHASISSYTHATPSKASSHSPPKTASTNHHPTATTFRNRPHPRTSHSTASQKSAVPEAHPDNQSQHTQPTIQETHHQHAHRKASRFRYSH